MGILYISELKRDASVEEHGEISA